MVCTIEELEKKTCAELRNIAKELDISGRWDMTKAELVNAIINASQKVEKPVEVEEPLRTRNTYVERAEVGNIIAFRAAESGYKRLQSAKITSINLNEKTLCAVTQYGREYTIPFANVVWVRTGSRWPKFVYDQFKGLA